MLIQQTSCPESNLRLFLGLDLPEDVKLHIDRSLAPLKKSPKGWEDPHDYHLTLLFIGKSTTAEAADVMRRMEKITFAPFTLSLGPLMFFPRRVMYLGLRPSGELIQLKDQIENAFSEWLNPDRREFIPHITIKRWQRYEFDALSQGVKDYPLESRSFKVSDLSLFKSEKNSMGQKYHVIKSCSQA